MRRKD
jgi:hypothetical protein